MRARSVDTDPDAERVPIELLRRAGESRRAAMALELSGRVIDLARQAIARSLPGASDLEIGLRFVELNYGRELEASSAATSLGGRDVVDYRPLSTGA